MVKNKRRIYMAYYHRTPTPSLPAKFHSSLLVTPKNPGMQTVVKDGWRCHVLDKRAADDDPALGYWIFEARKAFSRSSGLAGVVFLGKIPDGVSYDEIESILRRTPMQRTVAENIGWRCRHWVWASLTTLVDSNVIPPISLDPETVWQNGASFVEGKNQITSADGIPCCDIHGKSIRSELGSVV